MAKQLIVVVHGVGVKKAGVSSDLLATALDPAPEEISGYSRARMEEDRLRPHSTDDFELRELGDYNDDGKRQTFPARIRRYRWYVGANNDKIEHERIIADFYWGDISAFGSGTLSLLVALIKTILGIGHTIRENSRANFMDGSVAARIADAIVKLIHGPIAAFNLVMLAGAGAYWAARKAAGIPPGTNDNWLTANTGIAIAVLTATAGIYLFFTQRSFLGRQWIVIAALTLAASEAVRPFDTPKWLANADLLISKNVCRTPHKMSEPESGTLCRRVADSCANLRPTCETSLKSGIYVSGSRLLVIASAFWLAALVANALFLFVSLVPALRTKSSRVNASAPLLAPVASSGLLFLWMLFLMSLWAAPSAMGWELLPHADMLNSGLALAAAVAFVTALLFAAAVAVAILKWLWKRGLKGKSGESLRNEYFGGDKSLLNASASHRLIVNDAFSAVFLVGGVSLAVCGFVLLCVVFGLLGTENAVAKMLQDYTGPVIVGLGLFGVAIFAWFRPGLQLALGILIDVITYINDYDWRWGTGVPSRTMLERHTSLGRGSGGWCYHPRERIKNRFKVLMNELIRNELPDRIDVVSHSQGTVVALDVIEEAGETWIGKIKGGPLSLVTMGSPYTHIHHHYFPSSFPPIDKRPRLQLRKGLARNMGLLTAWTNIFRVDDFVGTHVDPQGIWPEEHPVPPNGHTYYWTDENVFPLLRGFLDIDAPKVAGRKKRPSGTGGGKTRQRRR
jgi:hypothetical protein